MSKLNLHEQCRTKRVIGPVACGVTGTGVTGAIIDRKGYNGVEFIANYGSVTATAATISLIVLEGDTTGSLTSVADSNLVGTETLASLLAGVRADGTTKNVSKRVGYIGNKRYVCVKEVPTATAGAIVNVVCLLHSPELAATTNP